MTARGLPIPVRLHSKTKWYAPIVHLITAANIDRSEFFPYKCVMNQPVKLTTPLSTEQILALHSHDRVLLDGVIFTARDAAHWRLMQLIEADEPLPIDLAGQIIYFTGPTPAPPGKAIGSAGPTTSSRMDAFSPALYERGLAGTIGKGYRGIEVRRSLQKCHAVHFTALGGAGALLSQCIKQMEIVAYEDLQTEAIHRLVVEDFPVTVAYDAHGQSVYHHECALAERTHPGGV